MFVLGIYPQLVIGNINHDRHANGGSIEILNMQYAAWTVYISFIGVLVLMLLPQGNARAARGGCAC